MYLNVWKHVFWCVFISLFKQIFKFLNNEYWNEYVGNETDSRYTKQNIIRLLYFTAGVVWSYNNLFKMLRKFWCMINGFMNTCFLSRFFYRGCNAVKASSMLNNYHSWATVFIKSIETYSIINDNFIKPICYYLAGVFSLFRLAHTLSLCTHTHTCLLYTSRCV